MKVGYRSWLNDEQKMWDIFRRFADKHNALTTFLWVSLSNSIHRAPNVFGQQHLFCFNSAFCTARKDALILFSFASNEHFKANDTV